MGVNHPQKDAGPSCTGTGVRTDAAAKDGRRPDRVQSVSRASRLLMMVADGTVPPIVTALAGAAGLAVPTTHHLLGSLVDAGLLGREEGKRYVLGPRVAVLAAAYQRNLAAPTYLLEPLQQLTATTGETSYLIAMRNDRIHILASLEGHQPVRVSVPTGDYADAHARAGGKLMLAYMTEDARDRYVRANPLRPLTSRTITDAQALDADLAEIHQRGFAREDEEYNAGVSCVAAPVLDGDVLIAGYSVSVPTARYHERDQQITRALLDVVASAQRRLALGDGQA